MIAESAPPVDQTLTLWAAGLGAFALVALVVARVRGRAVLRVRPEGFVRGDAVLAMSLAVFLFLVYFLCQFLVLGELGTVGRWVGVAAALAIVIGADRLFLRRVFRPRGTAPARIGEGLWVTWAALPLVFGLLFVMYAVFGEAFQPSVIDLVERRPGWQWLIVAAVLVAPLMEELVFRGFLYPALRQWTGVPIAIVVSGVLFGLIHWPPQVVPPLALLGIALAWIAESTGSLWPCVAAHMAFNGLTVAQVFLA